MLVRNYVSHVNFGFVFSKEPLEKRFQTVSPHTLQVMKVGSDSALMSWTNRKRVLSAWHHVISVYAVMPGDGPVSPPVLWRAAGAVLLPGGRRSQLGAGE